MSKILLVEDEWILGARLQELLVAEGYTVLGLADSGEEGLALAEEHRPDLVIMDIGLPGKIDGIAAAIEIRQAWGIPSLFITGQREEGLPTRAKAAEPLGYITKPLSDWQILSAVEVALHKAEMDRRGRENALELARAVADRTEELGKVNRAVDEKTLELKDMNTALRVLLKTLETGRRDLENEVSEKVVRLIGPCVERLRRDPLAPAQESALRLMEHHLKEIASPDLRRLSDPSLKLTPIEIQVAYLVASGKTSKDIAELLNVTEHTVGFHRENLRKRLGVLGRKERLRDAIASILDSA